MLPLTSCNIAERNTQIMKHIKSIADLFVVQLREQYSGERQQLEAMPKLRALTINEQVQQLLDVHIGRVRAQMERLDIVFEILGRNVHGEVDHGIEGIIKESLELAERCTDEMARDAGIISSIQHMNHYNIASYRTLTLVAGGLELKDILDLLSESFSEEQITDNELFVTAMDKIYLNGLSNHLK